MIEEEPLWMKMGMKEMISTAIYNFCGACFGGSAIALFLLLIGSMVGNLGLVLFAAAILAIGIGFAIAMLIRDIREKHRRDRQWALDEALSDRIDEGVAPEAALFKRTTT